MKYYWRKNFHILSPAPPTNKVQGGVYIGICLSVQIPVHRLTSLTLASHIWHLGLSPKDVSNIFMILIQRWPLTSRSMGFLIWLCVRATAFLSFDLVIPYLAHKCIAVGWCVAWIHDLVLKPFHFHHERVWARCSMTWAYQIRHMTSASIQMGVGGGRRYRSSMSFTLLFFVPWFFTHIVFWGVWNPDLYQALAVGHQAVRVLLCAPLSNYDTRHPFTRSSVMTLTITPAASHLAGELFDIRNNYTDFKK